MLSIRHLMLATVAAASITAAAPATAATVDYTASSTGGPVTNSLGLLSDGVIPPNYTPAQSSYNVYFFNPTTTITFDFGETPISIGSLLATVDNNDDYVFTFFNGMNSLGSRTIFASDGSVAPSPGGVETFSGDSAAGYTYLPALTFTTPFVATSAVLSIGAVHDIGEAVGEVQFYASPTAVSGVPEPASWALMLLGIGSVGFMLRRHTGTVSMLRAV